MDNTTLIVFKVKEQLYCVDILKVKEICMNQDTITLPNTPSFVEGIINLRGDVLCIINLANRLGIVTSAPRDDQKIIVTSINDVLIGFLVDEVNGILHSSNDSISDRPSVIADDVNFVNGVVKNNDNMIIYLDLNRVLNESELSAVENINSEKVE